MDTSRSSTPVAEPGASESLFDSTQLILPPQSSQSGSSSELRGRMREVGTPRKKSSVLEHAAALMQPPKKVGPPPTAWQSIRAILLASCKKLVWTQRSSKAHWFFFSDLNVLLICIPISVRHCLHISPFRLCWHMLGQWALNFALPNQHTLIFVCACSNSVLRHLMSINITSLISGHHTPRQGGSLAWWLAHRLYVCEQIVTRVCYGRVVIAGGPNPSRTHECHTGTCPRRFFNHFLTFIFQGNAYVKPSCAHVRRLTSSLTCITVSSWSFRYVGFRDVCPQAHSHILADHRLD